MDLKILEDELNCREGHQLYYSQKTRVRGPHKPQKDSTSVLM